MKKDMGQKYLIALVEDNPIVLNNLATQFQESGYEVLGNKFQRGFSYPHKALEALKSLSSDDLNHTVLVTDYDLQASMNGIQLILAMKEAGINIPTLVRSADFADAHNTVKALCEKGKIDHFCMKNWSDEKDALENVPIAIEKFNNRKAQLQPSGEPDITNITNSVTISGINDAPQLPPH